MTNKRKRHISLLVVLVLIVIGIIGYITYKFVFSDNMRIQSLLRTGNRYLTDEKYDEAMMLFDKALMIDPYCLDAYDGEACAQFAKAQQLDDINDILSGLLDAYFIYDDATIIVESAGMDVPDWFNNAKQEVVDTINKNIEYQVELYLGKEQYDEIKKLKEKYAPYTDYDFDGILDNSFDASDNSSPMESENTSSGEVVDTSDSTTALPNEENLLKVTFIKHETEYNESLVCSVVHCMINGVEMETEYDDGLLRCYDDNGNITLQEIIENGNDTYIIYQPQWYYSFAMEPTPDINGMNNEDLNGMEVIISYDDIVVRTLNVEEDIEFLNRYPTGHWSFDFAINNGNIEYIW